MQRNATNVHSLCGKHPLLPPKSVMRIRANETRQLTTVVCVCLVAFGAGEEIFAGTGR
jgi:hypothetical protein